MSDCNNYQMKRRKMRKRHMNRNAGEHDRSVDQRLGTHLSGQGNWIWKGTQKNTICFTRYRRAWLVDIQLSFKGENGNSLKGHRFLIVNIGQVITGVESLTSGYKSDFISTISVANYH